MSTAGRGIAVGEPSSVSCTPTSIVPFTQINGGTWQQTSIASIAAGATVTFGPQPVTGGSWSWTGPNGFTASTREITRTNIQSAQAGNYTARYTNTNGCVSSLVFQITINGALIAINEQGTKQGKAGLDETIIYPNPVTNGLTVRLPRQMNGSEVLLINSGGLIIKKTNASGLSHIDMSQLPAAVYFIKINNKSKSVVFKLVKK
jgi:xyloglucan-specific exo-beta-1,4-glucanase